jgi:hypothetical protein
LGRQQKVPSHHDSVKLHKCVEPDIDPHQSLSARLRNQERNGGLAFAIGSLLFMIEMRTRSTKLVSIILAISASVSVSSLPARLAEDMGNSFMVLKNASGVHFFTGDDAVGTHSPKDFSARDMLAVFTDRNPWFKNFISHTHSRFLAANRQKASFLTFPNRRENILADRGIYNEKNSSLALYCTLLI